MTAKSNIYMETIVHHRSAGGAVSSHGQTYLDLDFPFFFSSLSFRARAGLGRRGARDAVVDGGSRRRVVLLMHGAGGGRKSGDWRRVLRGRGCTSFSRTVKKLREEFSREEENDGREPGGVADCRAENSDRHHFSCDAIPSSPQDASCRRRPTRSHPPPLI